MARKLAGALLIFAARALPPFRPPSCPRATAAGFFPSSPVSGSGAASDVAISPIACARWFTSRGKFRLRERFGIPRARHAHCLTSIHARGPRSSRPSGTGTLRLQRCCACGIVLTPISQLSRRTETVKRRDCRRASIRRPRYNRGMVFVVKLTSPTGGVSWLSTPNVDGIRTLVVRKRAEVFQTYEDAHVAIRKMPLDTDKSGTIFSVESAVRNRTSRATTLRSSGRSAVGRPSDPR
jgi:hypothetical protein